MSGARVMRGGSGQVVTLLSLPSPSRTLNAERHNPGAWTENQENVVTERTTDSLVTFQHPFTLRDVVGTQPPGSYQVETVELEIDGLSFVAFRRISTTITLPAIGSSRARRQFVEIDPADLAAAQQKDHSASKGNHNASMLPPAPEKRA